MQGPQAYGRTAAEDAGFEAAFLANELQRPVRMQWTRQEETAWDTKGPAYAVNMKGALDKSGNLVALDYDARAGDFNHVGYNEADTVLIAQLIGQRKQPARGRASFPSDKYAIPNRRMAGGVVPMPLAWETPVRMGNLRDPDGPQVTFASESFIDELAAAAKADPVAFRLSLLEKGTGDDAGFKRARSIACVKAAAEKYGWDPRPSGQARWKGDIATGRGVAYAYRSETVVAEIVEVEVNRRTGRIWAKRIVCAHDCGLVINPEALTRTLENGLLHALSRALFEEARFDKEKMLTVDWVSSPTLTHADVPERIDIIQVNGDPNPHRPDLPHYGAGETICKPMLAAVANAVFDATGVRMRRIPFTTTRVLTALKS
jgi:CO/xanthine dehydrogenase Mo-binding subunit